MICSFCETPLPQDSRFCLMCGADLSDPEASTRQRTAIKELFEELKNAVASRYRVTDVLGRGGMGAVFLAEDLRLGRMVAIKVLRPELAEEPGFLGRFEREARIAAQLDHRNIIPIYEVAHEGGFHYFVMKHVAGKSLDELLAGQALPVDQARHILRQAALGLGHAHSRGVIHRDVKPSNIMVDDAGRVVITDFGISKALQASTQYTSTGQIIGTPRYVSPEQAQGLPLDGRSDQYSLAVVGYQMLVGRLPLVAETVHVLMYKHIYEKPVPAAAVAPSVPDVVSDALQRALAKEPAERFPSMEAFASGLWPEQPVEPGEAMPGPPIARRSLPSETRTRLSHRPLSRRLAVGVVLSLVAAAGLIVATVTRRDEQVETGAFGGDSARAAPAAPAVSSPPSVSPPLAQAVDSKATIAVAADTARVPERPTEASESVPPAPKPRPKPLARGGSRAAAHPAPSTPPQPPAPAKVGYLTINAIPYGAVSVDGVEIGDTPVVRRELPPGEHRIRITREGYRTDSLTATVTAGNEVRLSRSLVKEGR
jgi:hypothetical protein